MDEDEKTEDLLETFSEWYMQEKPDVELAKFTLYHFGHCLVQLALNAAIRFREQEPKEPVWSRNTGLSPHVVTELLYMLHLDINLLDLRLDIHHWTQTQAFLWHALQHDPSCSLLPAPEGIQNELDNLARLSIDALCRMSEDKKQLMHKLDATLLQRKRRVLLQRAERQLQERQRIATTQRRVFVRRFTMLATLATSFIGAMILLTTWTPAS